jgi:glycosyltransferase involved in cell wall biosynthesis
MKVFIDPRSIINYSSFYIKGLYDYFGKNNIHFSAQYFDELKEIDMLMAFVLVENKKITRFIIDYRDQSDLIIEAYLWTDVYAKINLNRKTLTLPPNVPDKIVHIPPSFPIKIWNPIELLFLLTCNFFKAGIIRHRNDKNIHLRPLRWIRNYLTLLKRQRLEYYENMADKEVQGYVFFVSTYWPGCNSTNFFRSRYILSCHNDPEIDFHGGFFVNKDLSMQDEIPEELIFHRFFSHSECIKNIKKSIFVFNTPAVCNCHGWKLGEFLCMGKSIISTPFTNELPEPLEHGKNIYWINNEKDIPFAIQHLLKEEPLRKNLGKNAKMYYEKLAAPAKVVEHIVNCDLINSKTNRYD